MPDEAIKKAGHNQGIFQVIFFFHQVLGEFAMPVDAFGILSTIPYVPFVEGQEITLPAAYFCLYVTTETVSDFDLLVNRIGDCQVIG